MHISWNAHFSQRSSSSDRQSLYCLPMDSYRRIWNSTAVHVNFQYVKALLNLTPNDNSCGQLGLIIHADMDLPFAAPLYLENFYITGRSFPCISQVVATLNNNKRTLLKPSNVTNDGQKVYLNIHQHAQQKNCFLISHKIGIKKSIW